jgi:glycosyltransferase involved in cell wall biosynthesis
LIVKCYSKIIMNLHTIEPFFSIIIPTFNRKAILTRALDSLLAQTEQNWEAIIIDDGSTDETLQYISNYLNEDNRIQYQPQKNTGAALAKNVGIEKAKGKFITFLDSDDEYAPHHLAIRLEILQQFPEIQFLYGGAQIIGNQFVPNRFDVSENIHLDDCVIGGTFFIERNLLLSLDGFNDIRIGEDADLYERLMFLNVKSKEVKEPTYLYYRDRIDSVTYTE